MARSDLVVSSTSVEGTTPRKARHLPESQGIDYSICVEHPAGVAGWISPQTLALQIEPFLSDATGVTGSGTANTVAKWTSSSVIGNSSILDDGIRVTTSTGRQLAHRIATASPVTIAHTDHFVGVNRAVAGATAVNLPASPATGQIVIVKDEKGDASSNNITITPAAGTIDGAANKVINSAYGSTALAYTGSEWVTWGGGGGGGTGTVGTLAKFITTSTVGDSIVSESGAVLTVAGNIVPNNTARDLGTTALPWASLHVSGGSVQVHNDLTNTDKATLGYSGSLAQLVTSSASLKLASGVASGSVGVILDTTTDLLPSGAFTARTVSFRSGGTEYAYFGRNDYAFENWGLVIKAPAAIDEEDTGSLVLEGLTNACAITMRGSELYINPGTKASWVDSPLYILGQTAATFNSTLTLDMGLTAPVFDMRTSSTTLNAPSSVMRIRHGASGGSAAAGFGAGVLFRLQNDSGEQDAGRFSCVWEDVVDASADAAFVFSARKAGAAIAEVGRISSTALKLPTTAQIQVGSNVIVSNDLVQIDKLFVSSEARGDVAVRGASAWGRLAVGASGTVLVGGTDPSYSATPTLTSLTLSGALTAASATLTTDNATNNGVTTIATLRHTTSGSPAAGIGSSLAFEAEGAGGVALVARLDGILTNVTGGSETSALVFNLQNSGGGYTQAARLTAAGNLGIGTATTISNPLTIGLDWGSAIASGTVTISPVSGNGDAGVLIHNGGSGGGQFIQLYWDDTGQTGNINVPTNKGFNFRQNGATIFGTSTDGVSFYPGTHNVKKLGHESFQWQYGFFGTGGIGLGLSSGTVPSFLFHSRKDAIGTAQTETIVLENTTAAAAGAQQFSPLSVLAGRGWDSSASASKTVKWGLQTRPVQGAANPSGDFVWWSSINAGAFVERMSLSSLGTLTLPTASTLVVGANTLVTGDKLVAAQLDTTPTLRRANASETQLTTTSATDVVTFTPGAQGNHLVNVYYRVVTATTNLTLIITYTDSTGAQTLTLVATATPQVVGSYTCVPAYINATAAAIKVTATAGTANNIYVSATISSV